ncbi:MAG: calcium/sodium antiporter [Rhodospirillales bacterium]
MVYLELVAGFALLVAGGDCLVRGAVALARRLGVSPLLIGLTLVGFGTSTPELLTSVQAALIGSPGIAVGNVVGSNTANILLILGIAALLSPLRTSPAAFRRDGTVVLLAALACVGVVLFGHLDRPIGVVLVGLLVGYIVYTYRHERVVHDASAAMHEAEASAAEPVPARLWVSLLFTVGGLALTLLGARLLVDGSIGLARAAGVSETIVGLTLVAIGTSLPELVTSIVAALRRQADVAFGNIVGSNIYNVFGILGVTAMVRPIPVPPEIARLDVWVMLAATLLLLLFSVTGWRVTRSEGGVLLAAYVAYIGYLASVALVG